MARRFAALAASFGDARSCQTRPCFNPSGVFILKTEQNYIVEQLRHPSTGRMRWAVVAVREGVDLYPTQHGKRSAETLARILSRSVGTVEKA